MLGLQTLIKGYYGHSGVFAVDCVKREPQRGPSNHGTHDLNRSLQLPANTGLRMHRPVLSIGPRLMINRDINGYSVNSEHSRRRVSANRITKEASSQKARIYASETITGRLAELTARSQCLTIFYAFGTAYVNLANHGHMIPEAANRSTNASVSAFTHIMITVRPRQRRTSRLPVD